MPDFRVASGLRDMVSIFPAPYLLRPKPSGFLCFRLSASYPVGMIRPSSTGLAPTRDVYSVSRLSQEARKLLEGSFPLIWLEGELSNLARPSSGHLYFSLKDEKAQVRGAMFRNRNQYLRFNPEDGMQVLVRARVSLYEPRGDFQIIVEHMEEAGDGALRRAFEALKERLAAEGLFDETHKQDLPALPHCIGVLTSPTGAAIRDVLSVLRRRFPAIPVLIYPVPVQGREAPPRIASMIRQVSNRKDCDILIITRGGGSLEDLWAFNEEIVARAIHDCEIPVISGIGHEIDFTIADFVADRRAPTPSVAAELASPDQNEWLITLRSAASRLQALERRRREQATQRLDWLGKRLQQQHPGQRLRQQSQRLDDLEQRLKMALRGHMQKARARLAGLRSALPGYSPAHRIEQFGLQCEALHRRLATGMHAQIEAPAKRLAVASRALHAVSPLATLDRGYAIVKRHPDGPIIREAGDLSPGDEVEARLARGGIICTVIQTGECDS